MPHRLITAAAGVVGLVVIGLGVASATAWKADDVLVATAPTGNHTLVTAPGVLELGGDPVTVRATTSDGSPVVLAIGRDTDVTGWVGSESHATVTGLDGWHTLAVTTKPSGSATPGPTTSATAGVTATTGATPTPTATSRSDESATTDVADPTGSDLWVAQATGNGSARLVWPAQPGRWTLLAVGTDTAPQLSLSWPRVVTTPWLWPCVVLGSLLVLAAAALLARDRFRGRGGDEAQWEPVTTDAIPAVGAGTAGLTRRQIREAQEAARSSRPRTGAIPRVAAPPATSPAPAQSPAQSPAQDPAVLAAPPARPDVSTIAPSVPVAPTQPLTRRALRTGAIPVVPDPVALQPAQPGQPGRPDRSAASGEPDDTTQVIRGIAATSSAEGTGQTEAPPEAARPAWLRAALPAPAPSAGSSWTPPTPTPDPATGQGTGTPAARPHARPTWLPGGTNAPTAASPSSPAPTSSAAAAAGEPDASAADLAQTMPVVVAPTDPAHGSRADAWRRAWGLPPTQPGSGTDEAGDDAVSDAANDAANDAATDAGEDR
ncbi:hypothetical protein [Cellulomonas sp. HZM]|uniref:hypothetical protein n=1 Tax=Cellulomonas sp. HZM TaxID=1454010 RepID=UPI0004934929|nr:hypothetical protein [Cellulomonas sp. HZM]